MLTAAMLVATFAYIFVSTPDVYAADADWKGDSIVYEGNTFEPLGESAGTEEHNIPKGSRIYRYIEPAQDGANNPVSKAHLIYFAPGTDPTKATSANFVTYNYASPDDYSTPVDAKPISLTLQSESAGAQGTTSCVVEGIGWIICPVTNFLAEAMDWLFGILAGFLEVRPAQTDPNNSLFRGWSIMRDFANVAFVIGFLIIIYSQISNIGLSNYGIKRVLPRLIVAAVLVNISYWICAVAIDVSNILGYSLQDLFMSMRDQLTGTQSNSWEGGSWKDVSTAILSGGTIAAAGITALISVGSITGAIYMLLPILVGVLIAVLVAIIIMAARQALIVILVIIAPLAFVAYLLPNTEKYFDKWKDLFITMLMLFPIFSVLFGGAQLAGTAIIQNSDTLVMKILGMAVQVAPVVILPLLIKFSGSLLGRIAGMVNDKSKGLMDRTTNFAKDQAALKKAQTLARGDLRRRNVLARSVQGMDNRRRKREGWQKTYEAEADNRWHQSAAHEAIDTASREASRTHKMIESQHDAHWNNRARTDTGSLYREMQMRVAGSQAKLAEDRLEALEEEFRTGEANAPAYLSGVARQAQDASREIALTSLRKKSAERLQGKQLTDELLANTAQIDGQTIREYGGGVLGTTGAETVFAGAVNDFRSEFRSRVAERQQLIDHFNLDSTKRQQLAMGKNVEGERDGVTYIFKGDDDYAREAAIDIQLKKGSFGEKYEILKESGAMVARPDGSIGPGKTYEYRTTVADAVKDYGLDKQAIFFGSQSINDIAQGKINGDAGMNMAAARVLAQGKVSDESVSAMNAKALERMFNVTVDDLRRSENFLAADATAQADMIRDFTASKDELAYSAWRVMHTPVLSRNADKLASDVLKDNMAPPPPSP